MRLFFSALLSFLALSCAPSPGSHGYRQVTVSVIYEDSASFRALDVLQGSIGFAGSEGVFGSISTADGTVRAGRLEHQGAHPEFRAAAHTETDFFLLSAGDPALLYKTGDAGSMELVYSETGPGVFYDAMAFWDNSDGLAVGDSRDGCLSILRTRDGGNSWQKLDCGDLPPALPGEGAFAASNTNIALSGDQCWVATSGGRVFHSPDRGKSWEVFETPAETTRDSQGIFSIAFHNDQLGFAIGGDYADPDVTTGNKMVTRDGGRTWSRVAEGALPGYKSCVQFVPGSGGEDLVAVGYTGIVYSQDQGNSWRQLSEEGFYSLRFTNDSVAYASGRGRIARLVFLK
ncbi:YCF48-related protein [Robiginitalea sp. SC105]|uniref:WD40/YVTN/BNR-like repeat-containing protein n=1 Tax=Robiginitalea sp. SC105 TaxID=2762332 RepID=UPI00163996F5|nr:YCF48-related protein [Robiginitalea sp. SC105]MBC2839427.1 oxidoreductase [Robiginitalea sp. SC105]